jgi:hypothetical protein
MTEEELFRLSDDELEKMFYDAKAEGQSPDVDEENMEQPVEDSDDNGTEEIELDDEAEEPAEVEESDETTETEEEPTEAEEEKEIAEVQEVQKVKFKANGKEYEFTEDEIKSQFPKIFGQAMDYTKKTQAIKPWRKTIDAIEQAKLSHDDVNLMIDVLRGDKDAIAAVMKRTGVDALELDTENSKYVPKDYGRDDNALAIKDVIDEISADKEYEITHKVLSKDWDDNSFKEMTKDPELIKQLHIDVKTGMFNKVQPIADKMKVIDRGRQSDLDYYKMAAVEYFKEQEDVQRRMDAVEQQRAAREAKLAKQAEVEKVREAQTKREKVVEKTEQRKAAAPTKSNAGTKKVVDYLDDSDEAYEEWYKQMEAKR